MNGTFKTTFFVLPLILLIACTKSDNKSQSKADPKGPTAPQAKVTPNAASVIGVWELVASNSDAGDETGDKSSDSDKSVPDNTVRQIHIEAKKVTLFVDCKDLKATAQTSSPAILDEQAKTIETLEATEKSVKSAVSEEECYANLAKGKLTYELKEGKLYLNVDGGKSMELASEKKIRD